MRADRERREKIIGRMEALRERTFDARTETERQRLRLAYWHLCWMLELCATGKWSLGALR